MSKDDKPQKGWERADELAAPTYRNGVDEDGFPVVVKREAPSLLVSVGERRRREREAKLAAQRRKVEQLPRLANGTVLYPDGQGQPPTEDQMRRLSETGTGDEWREAVMGPVHEPHAEGWPGEK